MVATKQLTGGGGGGGGLSIFSDQICPLISGSYTVAPLRRRLPVTKQV